MSQATTAVLIVFICGVVCMSLMIMVKLRELHTSMNSRLDELLSTTRSLARAEGFRAGQEEERRSITDGLKELK